MEPRVAIVHDWLVSMRGGERVLESLCRLYPRAPVFTLRYDPGGVSPEMAARQVHPSFIDGLARRLPLGRAEFRLLLPLFPLAIESLPLHGYDLVISSSHAVAKGALAPPGALHVSYVHSPMRYVWEAAPDYAPEIPGGSLGRAAYALVAHYLRLWDTAATARVDALVANSAYTRARIRRCYGRDSTIIEPPVDTRRFAAIPDPPPEAAGAGVPTVPLYLCVSALVPYKRVDLAVRAFSAARPGSTAARRLVVVGDGPERARLARMAGPNVELRGRVSDEELDRLYAACRALIHPAIDDFGIAPREALAAGRPVVAFAGGGVAETVREGETGTLFSEPTPEALADAVARLEPLRFDPRRLRAEARRYDRPEFERRFGAEVEAWWRQRSAPPPQAAAASSATGAAGGR
jgi:glycosyltransferase involved in cell wall biosynthesis